MSNSETLWAVRYLIRTQIDGSTVGQGSCTVTAATPQLARDVALEHIYDTDYRADPRIDPQVIIVDLTASSEDE